ncbi:hypothetical protein CCYA_CCYA09G2619 [Cyanidiococcus yangmingshanensis]|nr:hypothetical protein CCYA_CCYA09G2619 [Cyanidiococcus yangmingshanensis]
MLLRSALRRYFIRYQRKRSVWRRRTIGGLLALLLILLLSRWRFGGPPNESNGLPPTEKLRVVRKILTAVDNGNAGRRIEVMPTSGSLGVITARLIGRSGQIEEQLRGCLVVASVDAEPIGSSAPVYVHSCPADEEAGYGNELVASRHAGGTLAGYTHLELWKHVLRSSPEESIWRRVGTGECLGLDTKNWQLVLGDQNCIVWDERKNSTLFRESVRFRIAQSWRWMGRYRAKSLRPSSSGCSGMLCSYGAGPSAPELVPWHLEPLPLRLEAATKQQMSRLSLDLDPPTLDALSAVPLSFRDRHRSTIGLVTVRRYSPLSKFPADELNRTRFPPGRTPPVSPRDGTIRYLKAQANMNNSTDASSGDQISKLGLRGPRSLCLSVTDLEARTVDLLPCESNHDDPNGQQQVWYTYGQRVYTALSHELCLNAETQRSLVPCPVRNATCGAVYATMASLILSFWRDPVYLPSTRVDPSMPNDRELVDAIHLFASGFPADEEYLRVYEHNPARIKIHRWNEQFRQHLHEAGALPLEKLQERRHAAGTLNYYAALRGLHAFASPERHLILLEDDVKVADDAWVNVLSSIRSVEKDLNDMVFVPNKRYGFPNNSNYAVQLYVPENWPRPRMGWRYAWLEHSRIYGTQAFFYPVTTRQRMVEHYLRGIAEARAPQQVPKYDIHLHYLDFPVFGLARSAFEHSGCASTGLGAGLHRSRTWTPCELLQPLSRETVEQGVSSVRWSGWMGAKRNPDIGPESYASPDGVGVARFYIVIADELEQEGNETTSGPLIRYASLSSALASAWADASPTLDRLERIFLVGSTDGPIAHHQAVQMCPDGAACIRNAMSAALDRNANQNILIFLQHRRPVFGERALAFPDGWFQHLERVMQHLHSAEDLQSESPSLLLLGIRGRLPDESPQPSGTDDAPWTVRPGVVFQKHWDASICADLDIMVMRGMNPGQRHALQQTLRSHPIQDASQLCQVLLSNRQAPLVLLNDQSHLEMRPILETY